MLKLLVHEKTARLEYICEVLFSNFVQVDYSIFTDQKAFEQSQGASLLYGNFSLEGYKIPDAGCLKIGHWGKPTVQQLVNGPVLFPVDGDFDLPFDLFSAAFFLLSRMEEYQSDAYDEHGRYLAEASVGFKHGFLAMPIIEMWLRYFLEQLSARYPGLTVTSTNYSFVPTFDIDQAWAIRHYPFWRQFISLPADVKRGDFTMLRKRLKTWLTGQPDPYFKFGLIRSIHHKIERPIFFFLLGDYNTYNKNISPKHFALHSLIEDLADDHEIGIHPGVYPDLGETKAPMEQTRLERILKKPVTKSRQHYLRFRLPETYRTLIVMGIKDEYSMGYAKHPGFRAGCSRSFPWYDLLEEQQTDLVIHPISVMDVTLNQYLGLNPESAKHKIDQLVSSVRQVNGQFISLWHNSSLSELNEWKGWQSVYKHLVEQATEQQ